jgi:hypothetical protein
MVNGDVEAKQLASSHQCATGGVDSIMVRHPYITYHKISFMIKYMTYHDICIYTLHIVAATGGVDSIMVRHPTPHTLDKFIVHNSFHILFLSYVWHIMICHLSIIYCTLHPQRPQTHTLDDRTMIEIHVIFITYHIFVIHVECIINSMNNRWWTRRRLDYGPPLFTQKNVMNK